MFGFEVDANKLQKADTKLKEKLEKRTEVIPNCDLLHPPGGGRWGLNPSHDLTDEQICTMQFSRHYVSFPVANITNLITYVIY